MHTAFTLEVAHAAFITTIESDCVDHHSVDSLTTGLSNSRINVGQCLVCLSLAANRSLLNLESMRRSPL